MVLCSDLLPFSVFAGPFAVPPCAGVQETDACQRWRSQLGAPSTCTIPPYGRAPAGEFKRHRPAKSWVWKLLASKCRPFFVLELLFAVRSRRLFFFLFFVFSILLRAYCLPFVSGAFFSSFYFLLCVACFLCCNPVFCFVFCLCRGRSSCPHRCALRHADRPSFR